MIVTLPVVILQINKQQDIRQRASISNPITFELTPSTYNTTDGYLSLDLFINGGNNNISAYDVTLKINEIFMGITDVAPISILDMTFPSNWNDNGKIRIYAFEGSNTNKKLNHVKIATIKFFFRDYDPNPLTKPQKITLLDATVTSPGTDTPLDIAGIGTNIGSYTYILPTLTPVATLTPTSTLTPVATLIPCPYTSTDVYFSNDRKVWISSMTKGIMYDVRIAGFHNGILTSSVYDSAPSNINLYIKYPEPRNINGEMVSGINISNNDINNWAGNWFRAYSPGTYKVTARTVGYENLAGCGGESELTILPEPTPISSPPAPIISTSPPSVPSPSTSTLTLSIHLIGIGKGTYKYSGIGFNASIPDNPNPINRNRELEISKYSGNSCSIGIPGIDSNVFTYDKYSGKFVGNINLSPGTYCLKLNLPYYLNEEVVITIPASTTAINRSIELKPGDLDSDNDIDQNDVNLWEANYIMGSPERGLEYDINDNSVLQILIDETFIQVGARGGGGY
ncbi:hypothetical protein LBMAG33_3220 [Candidatus Levyibacteriota bacterium]|nr:hypothetical protein LBMAG33_3220 [Candidatus Levybacteria bacterium]